MSSLADRRVVAVPKGAAHGLSESGRSPSKLGVLEMTEDLSRAVRQPGTTQSFDRAPNFARTESER